MKTGKGIVRLVVVVVLATATVGVIAPEASAAGTRTNTTKVDCSPNSVVVGGTVTCEVTVEDTPPGNVAAPTGTVTFSSNGPGTFSPPAATCPLSASPASSKKTSKCSVTYTPTGTGTHTITANYPGDTRYATSSGTDDVTVNAPSPPRPTTTSVACNPSTVTFGGSTTCTATVTDSGGGSDKSAPIGTVTWTITAGSGTFSAATCPLVPMGGSNSSSCSVTYNPTAPGSHQITATYGGSATHAGSNGSTTVTVTGRPTNVTVACTPPSVPVDTSTTCTATVADTGGGGGTPPTGTVSWTASGGAGTFGGNPCTLDGSSSCSVSYTPTSVGTGSHEITATYTGDSTHAPDSGSTTVVVTARSTSTSVACSPDPVAVDAPTTCTVTVTDTTPGTKSVPTGSVTFNSDGPGGFSSNSCPLSASGTCSVTYTPTAIGTGSHRITATYGGDAKHSGSSGFDDVTVTKRTTSTTVTCSPSTVPVDGSTTCTATVSDTDSGTKSTPTGTVSFTTEGPGGFDPIACTLINGSCSVTYTPTAAGDGNHTITAAYQGDAKHDTSSGQTSVTVILRTTTTSVTCTPSTFQAGTSTTCTATVTDTAAGPRSAPEGTVIWTSSHAGGFTPNPCTLVNGSCSVSYASTVAATHTVTGSYVGNDRHAASEGSTRVVVTPGPPARVTVDPPSATNTVGEQHCVTARVTDEFSNPTPGITVFFSVTGVNRASGQATTGPTGTTTEFCYIGELFGVDTIRAVADRDADGAGEAGEPSGTATKTWILPGSTAFCETAITGGGRFTADNGDKATFGGNASVNALGMPTGEEEYQDHGPAQPRNVHSINVLAVVCNDERTEAQVFGQATVDGSGVFNFLIELEDHGEPGRNDTYRILMQDGYDSGRNNLEGGNIQIH